MQWTLLFSAVLAFLQDGNSQEQLAFDYFMREVYLENYSEYKFLAFSGVSKNKRSIKGPFSECFSYDENFTEALYGTREEDAAQVDIKTSDWHQTVKIKKSKMKNLNLEIYRHISIHNVEYVYIYVYKSKEFIDHFLIKISGGKVIGCCHFNEVI